MRTLHRIRRTLPNSMRSFVEDTPLYGLIYDLARWRGFHLVPVNCGYYETELLVPKLLEPYWMGWEEYGSHEPLTTRTWVEAIDEGNIVWDMGSRLGYFCQIASEQSSPRNVTVFEANPAKCRILRHVSQTRFDGSMTVVNRTIGSEDGMLVPDEYSSANHYPDVIKMDLEGAEVAALKGMETILGDYKPVLIMEMHPPNIPKFGGSVDGILETLEGYYQEVRVSFDFREPEGDWYPVTEKRIDRMFEEGHQLLAKE